MASYDDSVRGRRVRLVYTSDPYTRLRPGSEGTAQHLVPDTGELVVRWDDGSCLGMIPQAGDRWEWVEPERPTLPLRSSAPDPTEWQPIAQMGEMGDALHGEATGTFVEVLLPTGERLRVDALGFSGSLPLNRTLVLRAVETEQTP